MALREPELVSRRGELARVDGVEHCVGAPRALGEQHACERKLRRGVLVPRPYAVAVGNAAPSWHIQILVSDLLHPLQG